MSRIPSGRIGLFKFSILVAVTGDPSLPRPSFLSTAADSLLGIGWRFFVEHRHENSVVRPHLSGARKEWQSCARRGGESCDYVALFVSGCQATLRAVCGQQHLGIHLFAPQP